MWSLEPHLPASSSTRSDRKVVAKWASAAGSASELSACRHACACSASPASTLQRVSSASTCNHGSKRAKLVDRTGCKNM